MVLTPSIPITLKPSGNLLSAFILSCSGLFASSPCASLPVDIVSFSGLCTSGFTSVCAALISNLPTLVLMPSPAIAINMATATAIFPIFLFNFPSVLSIIPYKYTSCSDIFKSMPILLQVLP